MNASFTSERAGKATETILKLMTTTIIIGKVLIDYFAFSHSVANNSGSLLQVDFNGSLAHYKEKKLNQKWTYKQGNIIVNYS